MSIVGSDIIQSNKCKSGFTLIELLVVIAIIAILAGMLLPVMTNAKERASQQRCLNNLRQLASAVGLYTNDYSSRMPNPRISVMKPSWEGSEGVSTWIYVEKGQLFRYIRNKDIYACPVDVKRPALGVSKSYSGTSALMIWARSSYPLSYSMNCDFINQKTLQTLSLDLVRRPCQVLLLIHESRNSINDGDFNWRATDIPTDVHYEGTTVVYADQHAVWRSAIQLKQQKTTKVWDPLR